MDESVEQGQLIAAENPPRRKRPAPSKRANDLDGKTWLRNSISIWSDISKTPEEIALKHPAMFPTQLVSRFDRIVYPYRPNRDSRPVLWHWLVGRGGLK